MLNLKFENVSFAYNKNGVEDISVEFAAGKLTALVGLNGAGKSTCLKLGAGLLSPQAGAISFSDARFDFGDPKIRAQRIAYLPQFQPLVWALACRDIVGLGRLPYGEDAASNEEAVEAAMRECAVAEFADTPIDSLSGGEQARVLLARVLAGDAGIYLLDEPTRSLDLRRQFEVMALLRRCSAAGKAVVIVLHDLSIAARFCDELVLLDAGRVVASGSANAVFTPQRLSSIFGVAEDMLWQKTG